MASNGSDAAYHEPATTWRVARDLAEQAGRGMNQRSQPQRKERGAFACSSSPL